MAVSISVPFLERENDVLEYHGEVSPIVEFTDAQLMTLKRIRAGMIDAGVPLTAVHPPVDELQYILDLVTAAAAE